MTYLIGRISQYLCGIGNPTETDSPFSGLVNVVIRNGDRAGEVSDMSSQTVAGSGSGQIDVTYHPRHGRGLRIGSRVLLSNKDAISFCDALVGVSIAPIPAKRSPGRPRKDALALSAPVVSDANINSTILKELIAILMKQTKG